MKSEHFPILERLHTDVLEDKYGPISAKVIRHDNVLREVHLIDENGISRTYAITFFTHENLDENISSINEEIKSGEPIGKAFRNHGYEIRKNVIDVYSLDIPTWLQKDFRDEKKFAKARLSEFFAKHKNDAPIIYGTVVEVYSPDFRGPVINQVDINQVNPSTAAFEQVGITKDQIWERLGSENNWSDLSEQYELAKEKSLPLIHNFELKIKEYLSGK